MLRFLKKNALDGVLSNLFRVNHTVTALFTTCSQDHFVVLDVALFKLISYFVEPKLFVETNGAGLGVEVHRLLTDVRVLIDIPQDSFQQQPAHSLASVRSQYCEPL